MKRHLLFLVLAFACSAGFSQSNPRSTSPPVVGAGAGAADADAVDLAILLATLQPQLERAAALLAHVNQGEIELPPAPVRLPATPASPPPETAPGSGERLSDNLSANHSHRSGANLSSNLSVPAGPPPSGSAPLGSPVATASGVVRGGSAPVVVQKPVPPATYRSLASLEQQVRQLLPLVAAVNNNETFRALASSVTPASPTAVPTQPGLPTPTGRTNSPIRSPQNLRLR